MRTYVYLLQQQLSAEAEAWQHPLWVSWLIILVPILLVLPTAVLAVLAFLSPDLARPLFTWITAEDSLIEWLQFSFIGLSAWAAWRIGLTLLPSQERRAGILYIVIALVAVFIAGEEISWGQRLIGWGTPTEWAAINEQGETTIHNVGIIRRSFLLMLFMASMYGAFVPLAQAAFGNGQTRTPLSLLFVPPVSVVPAFLLMFGYRLVRMTIWEHPNFLIVKFAESVEAAFYFGALAFLLLNLHRLRKAQQSPALGSRAPEVNDPKVEGIRL
ncbi:hypothetical protein JKG68_27450 [Microvirga aerilata]|uniref:Uncharacterized protein n=1 Tax=Microvirga aerilata TaxID=670292 RepID=A0A937D0D9_9HYPH|nr:hypothetical protein [Microvirga aerilata]MBL0407654.1 hypothetical protein [Microvirga aerilata]